VSLAALYVYSATKFRIDGNVECYDASTFTPASLSPDDAVQLPPGVYRLSVNAPVVPGNGPSFVIQYSNGTKKPFPDPPPDATQRFSFGKEEAHTFFGGLGEEDETF